MAHVEFLQRHEHAGRVYGIGQTAEVGLADAEWLITHGVASRVDEPAPDVPAPERGKKKPAPTNEILTEETLP